MKIAGILYAEHFQTNCKALIDGRWVNARPCPLYSIRSHLKAVFLVLTGRADALIWHKQ